MSQICRHAANVFIWFGSSTPTTSLAVDLISRLATHKSSFRKLNPSSLTFLLEELEAAGLSTPEGFLSQKKYSASAGRVANARFTKLGRSLVLQAVIFDQIYDIVAAFEVVHKEIKDFSMGRGIALQDWYQMLANWYTMVTKHKSLDDNPWRIYLDLRDIIYRTVLGDRWLYGEELTTEPYQLFCQWLLGDFEPNAESMDKTFLEKQAGATLCMERFDGVCGGRRFFVTQQGYISIGPQSLIKGDAVASSMEFLCASLCVWCDGFMEMGRIFLSRLWRNGSFRRCICSWHHEW